MNGHQNRWIRAPAVLSACPLPSVSSIHKPRALPKLPLLSVSVRWRNESDQDEGEKSESYSCQTRWGRAWMRRACVTGVCALVTWLCKDKILTAFCSYSQQCWEHLLPCPRSAQWNEERGKKKATTYKKKNLRATEREKKGLGEQASMVNENINHLNETYESVSRIMLWILPSAT